jgi:SAM-dependent methyltransferase
MIESDHFNTAEATSQEHVDRVNAKYYGRFPFPWPADMFVAHADPSFWRTMVNQELGFFDGRGPLGSSGTIWVAGCGTNQGVQTALRFPDWHVYATDVSEPSLRIAEKTARSLGLNNVTFERASINEGLSEHFDYVICTGVIHHNADPGVALGRLSEALKPDGILELMVYNQYHRLETTSLQKAVRMLVGDCGKHSERDDSLQLAIAERLMDGLAGQSRVMELLRSLKGAHSSKVADSAIQPVEWSYTVASLSDLVEGAGLSLWLPTQNIFDLAGHRGWHLDFTDLSLRERYNSLPDTERWQLCNLLMAEESPWLWFYLRPNDVPRPAFLSDVVAERFLDSSYRPAQTDVCVYVHDAEQDRYLPRGQRSRNPSRRLTSAARALHGAAEAGVSLRDIAARLGVPVSNGEAERLRLALTTPHFPHLRAVGLSVAD